jgi:putative inorganic carbon (HCO3(-)) transporter
MLLAGITIGATLVAACGIAQQVGFDLVFDRSTLPGGRVFATIGQPNALAAYLLVAIPVAAALLLRCRSPRVRLLVLAAMASMIASLLFTYSRSGYLGLVIVLPIVVVVLTRCSGVSWGGLARTMLGLVIVSIALFAFVQPLRSTADEMWRRAISSFDIETPPPRACLNCGGPGDISIRRRLDFWMVAGQMALDHPLLGIGQETYPDRFAEYSHELLPADRARVHDQFRVESPHNVPLAIAAGSGIPSLVAYLAIIVSVIVLMIRAARAADDAPVRAGFVLLLAAMFGHLVTDMFMTAELTSTWVFWVLMGVGVSDSIRVQATVCRPRGERL